MKVRVKAGSSKNLVIKNDDEYIVYVKEKAEKGRANKAVVKLLKKYFGKEVRIVKGLRSKIKIVEVL